jgi:hypothetical protein
MEKTTDFLLKEYEAARGEMADAVKETRTLERYALLTVAAIWSWVVASRKPEYDALKWLPALIVVFFAFRALVLTKHVDFIANYLEKIEKQFALPDSLGFEQQFKNKGTLKRLSAYVFWGLLFVASVIIPYAYKA